MLYNLYSIQVEQDFQKKREREKKRIKQQLQMYHEERDEKSPPPMVPNALRRPKPYANEAHNSYQSLPVDINENDRGLMNGLKRWVKGKKDGYGSDSSSISASRRVDGEGKNIRAEIIAAAKYRNGVVDSDSEGGGYRPYTPDSKSLTSESGLLTKEIPELRQGHQTTYREYRRSPKKMLMPGIQSGVNGKNL